jgi:molecular chaperone DnaK
MPEELRTAVETEVKNVREALQANDAARIQAAVQALETAMQQAGQAVYSQPQPDEDGASSGTPGAAGQSGSQGGPAGTVEGEFREVK